MTVLAATSDTETVGTTAPRQYVIGGKCDGQEFSQERV